MPKVKQKKISIIEATLKVMAVKNSTDITIRDIAKQANVNVAAINYYFDSKEQLLEEVANLFCSNYMDISDELKRTDISPKEKLINWIRKAQIYAVKYPAVAVIMRDQFANFSKSVDGLSWLPADFQNQIATIEKLFQEVFQPAKEQCSMLFLIFLSSAFFPFLVGSWLGSIESLMSSDESLNNYIEILFKTINNSIVR